MLPIKKNETERLTVRFISFHFILRFQVWHLSIFVLKKVKKNARHLFYWTKLIQLDVDDDDSSNLLLVINIILTMATTKEKTLQT